MLTIDTTDPAIMSDEPVGVTCLCFVEHGSGEVLLCGTSAGAVLVRAAVVDVPGVSPTAN